MKSWLLTMVVVSLSCGYLLSFKDILYSSLTNVLENRNMKPVHAKNSSINVELIRLITLKEHVSSLKEITPGSCRHNSHFYNESVMINGADNTDEKLLSDISNRARLLCPQIKVK